MGPEARAGGLRRKSHFEKKELDGIIRMSVVA